MGNDILKDMDKLVSIVLICFSILLISYVLIITKKPIYLLLGFFMLFTGIIWLYLRKKSYLTSNPSYNKNYNQYICLNIIFFLILSISLFILLLSPYEYVRPISYFILASIMAGVIALEILYAPSKKANIFIIFQVVLLGLSISLSELFLFPTVLGVDPWWHQTFTSLLLQTSSIPGGSYPYAKIPIFHLLIANTSLITGLNYKLSSILSVTLPLIIICVLLIYNIGKHLISDKIGLLASLILVISNYFINGEIMAIPTTLGGIFLLIIIYLLINFKDRRNILSSILAFLFMFVLILTHTIVSLELALILFGGWITLVIYNYLYKKPKDYFSLTISLLFAVAMIGWWMYASGTIENVVKVITWGLNVDPSLVGTSPVIISYISSISLNQQIFINLGTFILFSLAILGLLFLISRKYSDEKRFLYGIISFIPLLISFVSIISGHSIIEGRWLFIAEILLAIPVAIGINIILKQFTNKKLKSCLLFGIIFVLSFFMILNSNVSSIDNSQFYPDGTVRYALTTSELTSFDTISNFNVNIKTDDYYLNSNSSLILKSSEIKDYYSISDELYYNNITNVNNTMILVRSEIQKNPFILYGPIYKLNYTISKPLEQNNFSILYDSGSVKGYYKF